MDNLTVGGAFLALGSGVLKTNSSVVIRRGIISGNSAKLAKEELTASVPLPFHSLGDWLMGLSEKTVLKLKSEFLKLLLLFALSLSIILRCLRKKGRVFTMFWP